jgi:hypothetical protein
VSEPLVGSMADATVPQANRGKCSAAACTCKVRLSLSCIDRARGAKARMVKSPMLHFKSVGSLGVPALLPRFLRWLRL